MCGNKHCVQNTGFVDLMSIAILSYPIIANTNTQINKLDFCCYNS